MRLRNEEDFLDQAFETHVQGLDELVVVFNNCTDRTPEICEYWARQFPNKIKLYEYTPVVYPVGTQEARSIDPRSENSLANYYNFTLSRTTREIVIKIDGDHIGDQERFTKACDRVRRRLGRDERWPIFGLNIVDTPDGVGIYNFYQYSPQFRGERIGPAPFTTGDQAFYFVDESTWHSTDPEHGYELMNISHKKRSKFSHYAYLFFHAKGLKADAGTSNWTSVGTPLARQAWIDAVSKIDLNTIASIPEMCQHNPEYFVGADVKAEFKALFPERTMLRGGGLCLSPRFIVEALKLKLLNWTHV